MQNSSLSSTASVAHTPGPWYFGSDAAEDTIDHRDSGLAMVDTGRQGDWPIARLCEWNNVALIAAAPDLLAMLQRLVADFDGSDDSEDGRLVMADAKAAIAKAGVRVANAVPVPANGTANESPKAPYPWCRSPTTCRGSCPRDPNCGE